MRARTLALSLTLILFPILAAAAPTAILVDTSRSIPPAQFEALKARIGSLLPDLLAKGPVALYAFNDAPVKLADFTSDQGTLGAAVGKLVQGGQFTLLNDCLFQAERDLAARGEPGIILLFTDGRDENSAVTLEDFASRASAAHVAVVSSGMGAADEKILRRFAVLTGGQYAGSAAAGGDILPKAFAQTASSLPPPRPATQEVPHPAVPGTGAAASPTVPIHAAAPPPSKPMWPLILGLSVIGLALLAAIGAGVITLLRRTREREARACEQCGRSLNLWEGECPVCLAQSLALPKAGDPVKEVPVESLPEIDPVLMQKAPPSEMLEHTLVLDQVAVLVLQRQGGPPRMFQLPPEGVVSVGRDKLNTLSVADQTLSAQHFRVIPKDGKFYLADLKSTNGTTLDGRRVSLSELKPGAVIRAGQCEFTFKLETKRIN